MQNSSSNELMSIYQKYSTICALFFLIFLTTIFSACHKEDDTIVLRPRQKWVERKVAIVAPLSDDATRQRLQRTAEWFSDNFYEAQLTDTLAISLQSDWYDESSEDMTTLSAKLAADTTIAAIIGPFSNDNVAVFAAACKPTHKPLIVPTATSEEVVRRYAVATAGSKDNLNKEPFLWSLTETDVTFADILMSKYATDNQYFGDALGLTSDAALFAPDDLYGQTFNYWAPFYAENDDINLVINAKYGSTSELLSQMTGFMDNNAKIHTASFCVVETAAQMLEVARLRRNWMVTNQYHESIYPSRDPESPENDRSWQSFATSQPIYFAFCGLSAEGIGQLGERGAAMLQGYQGFTPYADPTTGFELSYEAKFGVKPTFAECKFYDALMLGAFAVFADQHFGGGINEEIFNLTSLFDDQSPAVTVWTATAMAQYLSQLEAGVPTKFRGASGEIAFDSETQTTATRTAYLHWQILDGKIIHRSYFGDIGSANVSDANAVWRIIYDTKDAMEEFDEMADNKSAAPKYPALGSQYAVLVHGSKGFFNYRHLADVLNVYQMLRANGFDDDHIILIADQSVASDPQNDPQGVILCEPDGKNLMENAVIDYDASTLTPNDIVKILLGEKTEKLSVVLESDANSNVFLYWSGHGDSKYAGGKDELLWRDYGSGKGFSAQMMHDMVNKMQEQGRYRKMFVVTEPCFSENVIRAVEGIKGVLAISGASGTEQSWAENWMAGLGEYGGTWLCDRFSCNFVNCLADNPQVNYSELYLYCMQHTIGSHVKIVNAANFGNLYSSSPEEFIVKQ